MAAGVFSKVVHFALSGSTGNFDVTDAGITETPKLVIIFGGGTTNPAAEQVNFRFALGAYDGTNQHFTANFAQDAQLSANAERRRNTGQIHRVSDSSTGNALDAVSFLSNGVRLNATGTQYAGTMLMAVFFWGDDFSAKVGSIGYGTGTSAIATTGVGFEPNAILFQHIGQGAANTTLGLGVHTIGMAVTDGVTIDQRGFFYYSVDPRGSGPLPSTHLSDSLSSGEAYASNNTGDANPGLQITLNSFDADGFTVTPNANSGSVTAYYVAMQIGGGYSVTLNDISTPTTASSLTYSLGYNAEAVFGVITRMTAFNNFQEGTNNAASWGVFAGDSAGEQGVHLGIERPNTDPTQVNEFTDNANMIRIASSTDPNGLTSSALVVGTMTPITNDIEIDFTTVDASNSYKGWFFSYGIAGAGATFANRRFFFS